MVDSGEEKVQRTNGTVENNIVFLGGFFEQLGFEYVSGLEHEFVSVSPPRNQRGQAGSVEYNRNCTN